MAHIKVKQKIKIFRKVTYLLSKLEPLKCTRDKEIHSAS